MSETLQEAGRGPVSPGPRSYGDPCGIARALDLVGERWALLVVRELLLGPKRFTQLRAGLPEASPNVLSTRLRELEEAGIVRRRHLDPPGGTSGTSGASGYELTERGRDLEPVLLALGRWGSRTPMPATGELGVDALLIALKTTFSAAAAGRLRATYTLRLDDDQFEVVVADGRLAVRRATSRADALPTTAATSQTTSRTSRRAPTHAAIPPALQTVSGTTTPAGRRAPTRPTTAATSRAAGQSARPEDGVVERTVQTAVIDTDPATLRSVIFGPRRLDEAVRAGDIRLGGTLRAATRFVTLFTPPTPDTPTAPPQADATRTAGR